MTKIAAVFPGQGAQFVGMGQDLARMFPVAQSVFDRVDSTLGYQLSEVCFSGPESELKLTANTQPAILAVSVAAWTVLTGLGVEVDYFAGLSLGEYSAHVAAGSLDLETAAGLVRKRGQFMQEAVADGVGAMAALIGIDAAEVTTLCAEAESMAGGIVRPANFNCPGQIVISGHRQAVELAIGTAKERGASRAVMLPVSAPFHCPLMEPAKLRLAQLLDCVEFRAPARPVIANATAGPITAREDIAPALTLQVTSPVRWEDTIRYLAGEGVTTFLEVGPGTALAGFVRRVDRSLRTLPVCSPDDLRVVESLKEVC